MVTREPVSVGSIVTVTVEASGGSDPLPSQPQPKTTRRPGSTTR